MTVSLRYSLKSCCVISLVQLFVTPWAVARQAPLSMEFSRQECWSGLPFPFPGDLPDPEIKPASFASPALAGRFFTTEPRGQPGSQEDEFLQLLFSFSRLFWLLRVFCVLYKL